MANAAQQPRTVLKKNLVGCLPDPQSRVNCPTKQQQERERVPKQAKKPSSYDLIKKLGRTQASISILFALLQLTKKFSKNSLRVPRSRRAPPQQTFQIGFCWNFNGSHGYLSFGQRLTLWYSFSSHKVSSLPISAIALSRVSSSTPNLNICICPLSTLRDPCLDLGTNRYIPCREERASQIVCLVHEVIPLQGTIIGCHSPIKKNVQGTGSQAFEMRIWSVCG